MMWVGRLVAGGSTGTTVGFASVISDSICGGQTLLKSGRRGRCRFGTIWVYCGDHPSLTHNFACTLSSISKQAQSTPIRSRRKRKLFCATR